MCAAPFAAARSFRDGTDFHRIAGMNERIENLGRTSRIAAACLGGVCLIVILSGCADHNGTLSLESGPPVASVRNRQAVEEPVYAVHAGERARLMFTWRFDACDYAILLDESSGEYFDCGPPLAGCFEWDHTFGDVRDETESYRLIVEGCLCVGHRDRLPVRGKLDEHQLATDPRDSLIARAAVHVRVYQSECVFDVPQQGFEPAWDLTKLILTRDSGKETIVRRQGEGRRGFRVERVGEPAAEWRVRYQPRATEINTSGRTRARLILADDTGRTHDFELAFETP